MYRPSFWYAILWVIMAWIAGFLGGHGWTQTSLRENVIQHGYAEYKKTISGNDVKINFVVKSKEEVIAEYFDLDKEQIKNTEYLKDFFAKKDFEHKLRTKANEEIKKQMDEFDPSN